MVKSVYCCKLRAILSNHYWGLAPSILCWLGYCPTLFRVRRNYVFFFLGRATLKKKKKESVRTNIIQPGFRIAEGHKKRREKFAVTKLLMLFTKSLFEIGVTRANGEPIFFLIFLHSRRTHCQCYQTLTNQYSDSQRFFHLRNPTFFFSFPFSSESNKARIVSYTKSNPAISSCFD